MQNFKKIKKPVRINSLSQKRLKLAKKMKKSNTFKYLRKVD